MWIYKYIHTVYSCRCTHKYLCIWVHVQYCTVVKHRLLQLPLRKSLCRFWFLVAYFWRHLQQMLVLKEIWYKKISFLLSAQIPVLSSRYRVILELGGWGRWLKKWGEHRKVSDCLVGMTDYQGTHMGCARLLYIARMFMYRIHSYYYPFRSTSKIKYKWIWHVRSDIRAEPLIFREKIMSVKISFQLMPIISKGKK